MNNDLKTRCLDMSEERAVANLMGHERKCKQPKSVEMFSLDAHDDFWGISDKCLYRSNDGQCYRYPFDHDDGVSRLRPQSAELRRLSIMIHQLDKIWTHPQARTTKRWRLTREVVFKKGAAIYTQSIMQTLSPCATSGKPLNIFQKRGIGSLGVGMAEPRTH